MTPTPITTLQQLHFSSGSWDEPEKRLVLDGNELMFGRWKDRPQLFDIQQRTVSDAEKQQLIAVLNQIGATGWKKRYESNMYDGIQWTLDLHYNSGRKKHIYGSNAWPQYPGDDTGPFSSEGPLWSDLLKAFEDLAQADPFPDESRWIYDPRESKPNIVRNPYEPGKELVDRPLEYGKDTIEIEVGMDNYYHFQVILRGRHLSYWAKGKNNWYWFHHLRTLSEEEARDFHALLNRSNVAGWWDDYAKTSLPEVGDWNIGIIFADGSRTYSSSESSFDREYGKKKEHKPPAEPAVMAELLAAAGKLTGVPKFFTKRCKIRKQQY